MLPSERGVVMYDTHVMLRKAMRCRSNMILAVASSGLSTRVSKEADRWQAGDRAKRLAIHCNTYTRCDMVMVLQCLAV